MLPSFIQLIQMNYREELFYQLGLRQFGRFVRIKLKPAPPLKDLVRLAIEHDDSSSTASIPKEDLIEVCLHLQSRGPVADLLGSGCAKLSWEAGRCSTSTSLSASQTRGR